MRLERSGRLQPQASLFRGGCQAEASRHGGDYRWTVPSYVENPVGKLLMPSPDLDEPPFEIAFLPVAPDDAWGIRCAQCGNWFPRPRAADDDMNVCRTCRAGIRLEFLAVITDDIELIELAGAVLAREWWHASASDLIDLARTETMHWGSREAAIERAHSRLSPLVSSGQRVFLHRATILTAASIHPDVLLERPGEGTNHDHGERLLHSHDIVRYVNGTEGPGAVSLMLLPSSLAAVSLECELVAQSGVTAPDC